MLFLVSLDAAPLPLIDRMVGEGRLPTLAALMQAGAVLPCAPLPLAGVAYTSEYCGLRPADHGIYFPFQWNAAEQRVESWHRIELPETIFHRVDAAGRRMVVIDPPECFPQHLTRGFAMSGWQFEERVLLAPWTTDAHTSGELRRRFGAAPRAEESFGRPTAALLRATYDALARAPARLEQAAEFFLERDPPDVLWITCAGLHLASHQFFDLSLLDDPALATEDRERLGSALAEILAAYDSVIGATVRRLPPQSDVFAFCSKGIGAVVGWVDLLPEMLQRVLGAPVAASPVSALRAWVPRSWREHIAGAMPDRLARDLAARLWSPRADWSVTRAFTLPSDAPGFIRLNLCGRERHGVVRPGDAAALCAEISEGLRSFTDFDGEPCVAEVLRAGDLLGAGVRLDAYPDLVVTWAQKPSLRGRGVRSPRFGDVPRRGPAGTGRSGDHAAGAFAVVVPGSRSYRVPRRQVEPYDVPATILGALGLPHDDLPGHALLE